MNEPARDPTTYPVYRRPTRNRFSPAADNFARALIVLALLLTLCYGAVASYNLLHRLPPVVAVPDSDYARHHREMPTVNLSQADPRTAAFKVRERDQPALLLHIHNHVTAHGGILTATYDCHEDHHEPEFHIPAADAPSSGQIYHVNAAYLPLLGILIDPPWKQPLAYADWVTKPPTDPRVRDLPPDIYLEIRTSHLWFEDYRNKNYAIYFVSAVAAMLASSLILCIASQQNRLRHQARNEPPLH